MRRFKAAHSALMVIVVTAGGAWAHGRLANRWNHADEMRAVAAKALERTPDKFGDWSLREELAFEPRIVGILSYSGAIHRVYVHNTTGALVTMAMIVGPPGPTSSHYAELCYSSSGFDLDVEPTLETFQVGKREHELRHTLFRKRGLESRQLDVYYSWRQGPSWSVPLLPRTAFGGGRYLFKLQVAQMSNSDGAVDKTSGARAFLEAFLP